MKHRRHHIIALTLLMATLMAGCGETPHTRVRSAYYWSTTFDLDSAQRAFIHENGISRLYLRYFDVVTTADGEVMPNATVRFASTPPDSIEVVPTIFITNDCMAHAPGDLAEKILSRVLQMSETHDISGVSEIQIDCDWTARTREAYFGMLQLLRDHARKQGLSVSATIRLHQLSQEAPPVDHGVLMMYNTGDVSRIDRNPILDLRDAMPYMKPLSGYSLPLSAAYPIFSWNLLFRSGRFVGIMHSDDDLPVVPGDTIVHRSVPLDEVLRAKAEVDKRLPHANDEVILFDISKNNINDQNHIDYEKIFSN